ncbi:MAG: twin-arginine translocase subunit TatC [Phycisphaerales bacterium JB041]
MFLSFRLRKGSPTMIGPKRNPALDLLSDAVMPFGDHLEELRKRLIHALLGLLPLFVVSVAVSQQLLGFVIEPVEQALRNADLNAQLIQTSPTETFMTALKLAVVVTILVGSPWVLLQAWMFVAPGLYDNERRFVYVLLPLSAALTTAAIVFLYKVLLPVVLAFFIKFGTTVPSHSSPSVPVPEGVVFPTLPMFDGNPETAPLGAVWINLDRKQLGVAAPDNSESGFQVLAVPLTVASGILQQYRVADYTKLFLSLALAFALGFQTPVAVLLLGWTGIIIPRDLLKYRRHVAMVSLVLGAVLTPADPLSMLLLAVPLYVLFEFGVILHSILPAERVSRGFGKKPAGGEGPDAGDE